MDNNRLVDAVNELVASMEGSPEELVVACKEVMAALGTDEDIMVRLNAKEAAAMCTVLCKCKADYPFPGFILERSKRAAKAIGDELMAYGLTTERLASEWIETMEKEEAARVQTLEEYVSEVVH